MNSKIGIKLSKVELESILSCVIDPFYNAISNDDRVKNYIHSEQILLMLKHKQTLLAYRFFSTSNAVLDKHIKYAGKAHEKIGLPSDILYEYGLKMVALYEKWLKANRKFSDEEMKKWEAKLTEFLSLMMEDYEDKKSDEDIFFDIEEESRDSKVDSMHYDDADKIDAQTFMAKGLIHPSEIEDLQELLLDLEESIDEAQGIEHSFVVEFAALLQKISRFFLLSGEFKDMSYPMDTLHNLLNSLDIESLESGHKELLFEFIKSIFIDLKSWMREVLVNQSAKDIHYLDASLLANISQIEIMLADSDEDDDDFMF